MAHAPMAHAPSVFKSTRDLMNFLKHIINTKNLRQGRTVHAHLITTAQNTTFETNHLINFYVKCDWVSVARKLFDSMPERNVVSWNSLMSGYLHNGCFLEVIKLLKGMVSEGNVCMNEYVFATALASCANSESVEEGKQCHGYVLKSGLVDHEYVRNALVGLYSKCGVVRDAMRVWDSVPYGDVFGYNLVLGGLVDNGCLMEALEIFKKMLAQKVKWDSVTYVNVFGLCASLNDLNLGLQVHSMMVTNGVLCDTFVSSAIINMYGKCGDITLASRVFEGSKCRNVVLWTAMLAAFLQNGYFEDVLNMFSRMGLEKELRPNEVTLGVLLNASAGLSSLVHGCSLHACIVRMGFEDYVPVGSALINMYAKSGSIESANKVFSNMKYRDTVTWNAMICGYSHHGLGKESLLTFQHMLATKVCPNYITFVGVLSACGHLGLVLEGFYYLNHLMRHFGVEPGLQHLTCIVILLSRSGRLDEAYNFMRSVTVNWDVVAWRTLLNACHVHRNSHLGRHIASLVIKMEPNDVGTYILVSNMYAKANRWDGVAKIRKLMREKNIKKEPGVSWVDIGNTTHVFVSDDNKHPEYAEIYTKLTTILGLIKPMGYVPDIDSVLHDVDNEQKEDYLSYHSEKLAIAYGLMKMPSLAPIIVIKNLRICDDCHLAMKLISKVTNRYLIIRDTNRFHHFRDGLCSCGDYW